MGDFTGFSFNGFHSEDLGIVRVSDGDRYKDELMPEFDDATVDIPGGDGIYYFGSYYKSKKFTINIAFDHLTELQYRNIRRIFSTRKPGTLIFNEAPYKCYKVKLESPISLDTICFDEKIVENQNKNKGAAENLRSVELGLIEHDDFIYPISRQEWEAQNESLENSSAVVNESLGDSSAVVKEEKVDKYQRIYKGEGEIPFVAYESFAHAPSKTLDGYADYDNIEEWKDTAGLKDSLEGYDTYTNGIIKVYNPGDIDTPFLLYIPFTSGTIDAFSMTLEEYDEDEEDNYVAIEGAQLRLDFITRVTKIWNSTLKKMVDISTENLDDGIIINTKNQLIEGVQKTGDKSYKTTGTLYNNFIEGGNFFQIISDRALGAFEGQIKFSTVLSGNDVPEIIYDYIYF